MAHLTVGEDDENIIERGSLNEDDFHKNIIKHGEKEETSGNTLRDSGNGVADIHPTVSIQPWLVSADDGSLSDAISKQEP